VDTDGKIVVTCKCGAKLAAKASLAGQQARCPSCKAMVDVPATVGNPMDAPSPQDGPAQTAGFVSSAQPPETSMKPKAARPLLPLVWGLVGALVVVLGVCMIVLSARNDQIQKTEAALGEAIKARDSVASELEKVRKQLDDSQHVATSLQESLNAEKAKVVALQAENVQLKQTPRYYFDQAVGAMKTADGADTDDADQAAITKFQEIVQRFPEDALSSAAKSKIKELNDRITGRARALAKAQQEVKRLINVCVSSSKQARRIEREGAEYYAFHPVDSGIVSYIRRNEELSSRIAKAKESAMKLIDSVPDPGGRLLEMIKECDRQE